MDITWNSGQPIEILEQLKNDTAFREAWWKTEGIPGSYTRLNAAKLWTYAHDVPSGGLIVEIGVDQGRSTSLLLAAAERCCSILMLVDSWESILVDNKAKVEVLIQEYPRAAVTLMHMTSVAAAQCIPGPVDLLHIDADHYEGIAQDCEAWLPKLKSGGVACFHDTYSTFPAVTEAVDKYTAGWEDLGTWDSLAIRRNP